MSSWCCEVCLKDPNYYTEQNHMHPAPRGRPYVVWHEKQRALLQLGADVSWLPPQPPQQA